ncbi:hypothetical protein M3N64_02400 [Sporolactobacillus sp. CPB3-1]|uniref:Uncharacterized protein n=1 Tax=Sporolactobacillus mangiferae TaxID=2940498 RepID=A0ABT0M874_9BACL|nr:hypothetical protein [Sporolactobacillus mangiferae]MCL1630793.1 hypothetical protein [Sporolactobacillus mangiferae]
MQERTSNDLADNNEEKCPFPGYSREKTYQGLFSIVPIGYTKEVVV